MLFKGQLYFLVFLNLPALDSAFMLSDHFAKCPFPIIFSYEHLHVGNRDFKCENKNDTEYLSFYILPWVITFKNIY